MGIIFESDLIENPIAAIYTMFNTIAVLLQDQHLTQDETDMLHTEELHQVEFSSPQEISEEEG